MELLLSLFTIDMKIHKAHRALSTDISGRTRETVYCRHPQPHTEFFLSEKQNSLVLYKTLLLCPPTFQLGSLNGALHFLLTCEAH